MSLTLYFVIVLTCGTLFFASEGLFSDTWGPIMFSLCSLCAMGAVVFYGPYKEWEANQDQHSRRLGGDIYDPKIQSFLSELADISRSLSEIKVYLTFCATMLVLITVGILRIAFQ